MFRVLRPAVFYFPDTQFDTPDKQLPRKKKNIVLYDRENCVIMLLTKISALKR